MIKPDAIYTKSVHMYVIICMHLLIVCNMLILAPEAPVGEKMGGHVHKKAVYRQTHVHFCVENQSHRYETTSYL